MLRPEIEPKTELARRRRKVRRIMGDSERKDFANALDISQNSLAFYERGDNEPAATTLLSYIHLRDISAHWLLLGEGKIFNKGGKKSLLLSETDIEAAHLQNAVQIVEKALADTDLAAKNKGGIIELVYAMLKAGKNTEPIGNITDLLPPKMSPRRRINRFCCFASGHSVYEPPDNQTAKGKIRAIHPGYSAV